MSAVTFSTGIRAAALLLALLLTDPGLARDRRIIVVPIDIDGEALERADPVTRLAIDLLGKALTDRSYKVERTDWFDRRQRLGRRNVMSAHDWAREARRARINADALVAIKVFEYGDHRGDGRAMRVELRARTYALPGERVAHETSVTTRASSALPPDCDRDCVAAAVATALEIAAPLLAEDLAAHMPFDRTGAQTKRIVDVGNEREYTVDLEGFDDGTLRRIEDYLRTFGGYIAHEVIERNPCRQRLVYRTRTTRGRLEQSLRRAFREMKIFEVRLHFDTLRVQAVRPGCRS